MEETKHKVEISAKFVRHSGGRNPSIEVCLPDGTEQTWSKGVISVGANKASPNERKRVIAILEKEIDSFETGNCPTAFREILRELKSFGGMRKK